MAKYGPKAQALVAREMKAMEAGKLRSGSGAKVTDRKQAIAIALSEARKSGAKMPPPPPGTAAAEKEGTAKKAAKKSTVVKATAKKSEAKKSTAKKSTAKNGQAKKSA